MHLEGITATPLSGAVPGVSGWTGDGLPRGVDAACIRGLLASCDRRTAKGSRDLAIATHRLRHAVASELLRHGAGLPEIGQLLRHRSAAVTSIYARDTGAHRQLARPWPGGAA